MSQIWRLTNLFKFRDRKSTPPPPMSLKPYTYYLPIESWIEIIKIVLDNAVLADETCNPVDIPHLIYSSRSYRIIYRSYISYGTQYQATISLRLTCRAWDHSVKAICEHHSPYLIADEPHHLILFNGRRIKSLEILDSLQQWEPYASMVKPYPHQPDLLSVGRNISTVMISRKSSNVRYDWEDKGFLPLFVKHAKYFPNVRSLSIEGDFYLPGSILAGIGSGYPQLTTLQLSGCSFFGGIINLPNLKVFEFEIEDIIPKFQLPLLSHLSLENSNRSYVEWQKFFPDIYFNLVVLIDWVFHADQSPIRWTSLNMDIILPNLRLFGARTTLMQAAIRIFPRQPNHPLSHIWIIDSTDATVKTIRTILRRIPGLKRLTINCSCLSPSQLSSIRRKCQKKGIELIETTETESSREVTRLKREISSL